MNNPFATAPRDDLSRYASDARQAVKRLRRAGRYVCFAHIFEELPNHDRLMLSNVLWTMARNGEFS